MSRVLSAGVAAVVLLTLVACAPPGTTSARDTSVTGMPTAAPVSAPPRLSTIPLPTMVTSGGDAASLSGTSSPSGTTSSHPMPPTGTTAATQPVPSSAAPLSPTTRSVPSAPAADPTSTAAEAVYGTASTPIRVGLTGQVLKGPQNKVVMCPPYAVAVVGTTSKEIPTPECSHPVPVVGVDLDPALLTFAGHNATHSWGRTHIEAMWNGRSLTATSQRKPSKGDEDPAARLPTAVPCPAPTGGWKLGGVQGDPAIDKIGGVLGADFGALAMGYPHGGPTNGDGTNPSYGLEHTEQVLVVGVIGDIPTATAAIRKLYGGNLCVVHAAVSGAAVSRQYDRIRHTFDGAWDKYGIMSSGSRVVTLGMQTNQIDVVVRTREFDKLIASIPGPAITVNAWIQPSG